MATSSELTVADNPDKRRYEARAGTEVVGFIEYRLAPGRMTLLHTEVVPDVEGEGVGTLLVGKTLEDIRRRGLSVIPYCPFVVNYLKRHPEDSDLMATK
jgi:predicted GNAT family acetyltransferase